MKYFAYTLDLKDDKERIEEYLEYHQNSRKDVLEAICETGIVDEKIWISGNHLFMIVVAPDDWDPSELQRYSQTPAGKSWDDLMKTYQQPVPDAKPGEWWSEMQLVVDMDAELKKSGMR